MKTKTSYEEKCYKYTNNEPFRQIKSYYGLYPIPDPGQGLSSLLLDYVSACQFVRVHLQTNFLCEIFVEKLSTQFNHFK